MISINSRQVIRLLVGSIVVLLVVVFIVVSNQLHGSQSVNSPDEHGHVHNNHIKDNMGVLSPQNLRSRFKAYDLSHPVSKLSDPINKQQEIQLESYKSTDTDHKPENISSSDISVSNVSLMENLERKSSEKKPNISHQSVDQNQTNVESDGNLPSPTFSHREVVLPIAAIEEENRPQMDNIEFPYHAAFPLTIHQNSFIDDSSLLKMYSAKWSAKSTLLHDSLMSPRLLLQTFHTALRTGKYCEQSSPDTTPPTTSPASKYKSSVSRNLPTSKAPSNPIEAAAFWEAIAVKPKLFIEFSSFRKSSAAIPIALSLPHTTNILFDSSRRHPKQRKEHYCDSETLPDRSEPPSNVIVSNYPLRTASSSLILDRVWDCVQVITSLDAIFSSSSPLPFDVEHALGAAICRCNTTILPSQLPPSAFFSYWDDVDMLLSEAIASTRHICEVQVNSSGTIDSIDGGIPTSSSSPEAKYVYRTNVHSTHSKVLMSDILELDLSTNSKHHMLTAAALQDFLIDSIHSTQVISHKSVQGKDLHESSRSSPSMTLHLSKLNHSQTRFREYSSHIHRFQDEVRENSTPDKPEVTSDLLSADSNISDPTNSSKVKMDDDDKHSLQKRKLSASIPLTTSGSSSFSSSSSHYPRSSTYTSSTMKHNYSSSYSSSSRSYNSPKPSQLLRNQFGNFGQPRDVKYTPVSNSHWMLSGRGDIAHSRFGSRVIDWMNSDEAETSAKEKISPSSSRPIFPGNSFPMAKRSFETIPLSSRLNHKALVKREGTRHFHRWLSILHAQSVAEKDGFFRDLFKKQAGSGSTSKASESNAHPIRHGLVYIFGSHSTLLSVRVAKLLSTQAIQAAKATSSSLKSRKTTLTSTVVSLSTDPLSWVAHRELLETMELKNNILCHAKLTPEVVAALSVAPEQPKIVVLQLDIFVSLLESSLSRAQLASTSSDSPHEDDIGEASSALFNDDMAMPPQDEGGSLEYCSFGFAVFEEAMARLLVMGESVFGEFPQQGAFLRIVQQTHPLCMELAQKRYPDHHSLLAAITTKIILPKGSDGYMCSGGGKETQNTSERCLKLEIKAVESDDRTNKPVHSSIIYKMKLLYVSGLDFQLLQNVSMVRHIRQSSLATNISTSSIRQHVYFSMSRNEMKSRVRQIRESNENLHLWPQNKAGSISIYTLLHLGVNPEVKRKLLKLYIDFPFLKLSEEQRRDAMPWNIYTAVFIGINDQTIQELELQYIPVSSLPYAGEFHSAGHRYQESQKGISTSNEKISSDFETAQFYFEALSRDLSSHAGDTAQGKFSFVEHNSEYGFISAQMAQEYPNASVVSLERDDEKMQKHVRMLEALGIENNIVCSKGVDPDSAIFQRIYESPELFRFQLVARGLLESFANTVDIKTWGADLGCILSSALTTYVSSPLSQQVSLAMTMFFPRGLGLSSPMGPYRPLSSIFSSKAEVFEDNKHWAEMNSLHKHPTRQYEGFQTAWLLGLTTAQHGSTEIAITPVFHDSEASIPVLIRCDVVNMTRHVHHHYDYAKDGHSRTYTMRVEVNSTETASATRAVGDVSRSVVNKLGESDILFSRGNHSATYVLPLGMHSNQHNIVSVRLFRDKDSFPIPYTSIYGITLISILRLGIDPSIRDRLFKSFLFLPLYEDMAPWNIVLMGKHMAYIDYDTRDVTFDLDVPKAYQVISVLMNYKRTVEDFKRCGRKANTVYGLAFISDCVGETTWPSGSGKALSCPNLKLPVPCGDGTCHSDYISCLRSYSHRADELAASTSDKTSTLSAGDDQMSVALAEAMRTGIGYFSN